MGGHWLSERDGTVEHYSAEYRGSYAVQSLYSCEEGIVGIDRDVSIGATWFMAHHNGDLWWLCRRGLFTAPMGQNRVARRFLLDLIAGRYGP
jgi:hypothetical protein